MTTYSPATQNPCPTRSDTQNQGMTATGGKSATTATAPASTQKLRREPIRRRRPGVTREPAKKPTWYAASTAPTTSALNPACVARTPNSVSRRPLPTMRMPTPAIRGAAEVGSRVPDEPVVRESGPAVTPPGYVSDPRFVP